MIAAELRGGNKPGLNEALGWIGSRVDDIYGANVGRLDDVWIDPATGMPRWLLVKEGRFGGRTTLIPFEDATAGAGHVWIPYERDIVRRAPEVEPGAPLTARVESALREHYSEHGGAHHRAPTPHAPTPRSAYRQVPQPQPRQTPAPVRQAPGFAPAGFAPQAPPADTRHSAPIEAGSPAALGVEVSQRSQQPQHGDDGSVFGQSREHGARGAMPQGAPQAPGQQRPYAQPYAQPPPPSPDRRPAQQQGPTPGYASPYPPQPLPPASSAGAYPPPPAPRWPQSGPPTPQLAPAQPPRSDAAQGRGAEEPVAIPVINGLDRPQRVEIELSGELRISGDLKAFSLRPADTEPRND